MAGRKQHYIPQFVLKGFAKKGTGKKLQAYVFKKDQPFYIAAVDGIAAQRDFYSTPSKDGSPTLDDEITSYEGQLSTALHQMRDAEVNIAAPSKSAARFIAHTAVRTAHFRDTFANLVEILIVEITEKFEDPKWVRARIGLDKFKENSLFYTSISETLHQRNVPAISQKGLIEIFFDEANQRFPEFHSSMLENVRKIRENIFDIKSTIVESHNKSLSRASEPNRRIEKLESFEWKIYRSKKIEFVLPDCIAITISENGSASPYMWQDIFDDDLPYAIIAPLSRNCILFGYHKFIPKFENLNAHLASCSEGFFVSSDQKQARFVKHIGAWSNRIIDPFIATFIPW